MKKHPDIKVLLIEDNRGDARLIREMLDYAHYERYSVSHVDTLSEGYNKLSEGPFDAVLLDIGLPDSTGLESIREIRAAAPNLPIIMLTGIHDENTISSSLQMGAQDYLIKGQIDGNLLVRSVQYSIERMRAYQAIESKQRFIERANNAIPDVLFIFDITKYDLVYVNDKIEPVFGYTHQQIRDMGQDMYQRLVYPDDLQDAYLYLSQLSLSGDDDINDLEIRIRVANSEIRWVHLRSVVFSRNEHGRTREVLGIARDITERKNAEHQIKASLHEKELLLREIHHRVKNNMTVIFSLLKLQSRQIRDDGVKQLFEESMARIKSMALIHEKLYRAKDLGVVNFNDYIQELTLTMFVTYKVSSERIKLKTDVENVSIGIDSAIPCGLIVNELVSNAMKHAFPDGRKGEIRVALHEIDDLQLKNDDLRETAKNQQSSIDNRNSTIELIVSDNGIGMPEDISLKNVSTLGMSLVGSLVKQLHGTIEISRDHGTEFRIRFTK